MRIELVQSRTLECFEGNMIFAVLAPLGHVRPPRLKRRLSVLSFLAPLSHTLPPLVTERAYPRRTAEMP